MKKTLRYCLYGAGFYLIFFVFGFSFAWAQENRASDCIRPCNLEVSCEIEVAQCLIDVDLFRSALDRLKPLMLSHPEVSAFYLLAAQAYLKDNNPFWAQKTLQASVDRNPSDCESRSWLAWVHIKMGALDWAVETLDFFGCPSTPADIFRWQLLRLYLSRLQEDECRETDSFKELSQADLVYPEDRDFLFYLRRQQNPGWIQPLTVRFELTGGYTSNALAGSPTDPSRSGPSSIIGTLDLSSRLTWPLSETIRPTLEGLVKGHGLGASQASEFSYLEFAARPGVVFGSQFPRLQLSYGLEMLFLNQPDNNKLYEAHRAELELDMSSFFIFLGGGRRIFNQFDRTRTEVDGGVATSFDLFDKVKNTAAVSVRYHLADKEWYDLSGSSFLWIAKIGIGGNFILQLNATLGIDYYLNSGKDRFGDLDFGLPEKRLDLFANFSAGVWSGAFYGARVGVSYNFALRDSNADQSDQNYDYTEHRLLVKLRWNIDLDPWAPRVKTSKEHVNLDYGINDRADSDLGEERIRDLLRQEELYQLNSCGCE